MLGYAEATLANAAQLWLDAEPEQKVALQRALFPAGVTFGASGFVTSATCLMFGELQPSGATNLQLASLSIASSNQLIAWVQMMRALRETLGLAA